LATVIVILHAVEHHRAIRRGLIAQFNILVLSSDFDQSLAHQPRSASVRLGNSLMISVALTLGS
jgi:hypothetical protein